MVGEEDAIRLGLIPVPIFPGTVCRYTSGYAHRPYYLSDMESACQRSGVDAYYEGPTDTVQREWLFDRPLRVGSLIYEWRKHLVLMKPRRAAAKASAVMENFGVVPVGIEELQGFGLRLVFEAGECVIDSDGCHAEGVPPTGFAGPDAFAPAGERYVRNTSSGLWQVVPKGLIHRAGGWKFW